MISASSLDDLRDRNPVPTIAGRWVALRRGTKAGHMVGPCPICSPDPASRTAARFECEADKWVCAVCQDGGDVIRLVERHEGLDFRAAVAWLGGAQEVEPAEEARRQREQAEKKARQEAQAASFRERERRKMYRLWSDGRRLAGSPAEGYLVVRGLTAPPTASLRFHPSVPYFVPRPKAGGGTQWWPVHEGPAMLAAIVGPDGRFAGVHITWIDLDAPKGKLELIDPETGEVLPAKKVRGSMGGGRIELLRSVGAPCLIIGEGIETVLSVYSALVALGRPLDGIAMWSAVSLGNLAGPAARDCRERHPTAKDRAGRAVRIPGAVPDLEGRAVPIPDHVTDLRLLGDGDSDPFATGLAMERAAARHARPGRRVSIAWPEPGRDFNSMLVA